MKVKICGITDSSTAKFAAEAGADALGFVFAESKRKIEPAAAREIITQLPEAVAKVGVFVNSTKEEIEEITAICGLTHIQLHGDEPPEFCKGFRPPVIKALNIKTRQDIENAEKYDCHYHLFDSPRGRENGGTGVAFDWSILSEVQVDRGKLILAGGLTPSNVEKAIEMAQPYMVDVSSGVETEGKKDLGKIRKFIENAKQIGGN